MLTRTRAATDNCRTAHLKCSARARKCFEYEFDNVTVDHQGLQNSVDLLKPDRQVDH